MDTLVNLCKTRGYIYPGSEIYGGLANTWDFGPLGVELKRNLKELWWSAFIRNHEYNVGIQSAILMNPKTWEASGHLSSFADPLMDCRNCKSRFRADEVIKSGLSEEERQSLAVDGWSNEQMRDYIVSKEIKCPVCGVSDFTDIRQFNMMFKTYQGVTEDSQSEVYLRPETAQGMFVNFKNVLRTTRRRLPFGIGQIGKAFRNEITPGNFIFRTREFEQMELEFFCEPGSDQQWFSYWKQFCLEFLKAIGIKLENLRTRDHSPEELSHYSKATVDIEYKFPFGWGELWGIANRTDYDLRQHSEYSGEDLSYLDPVTNERFYPYCVEPSVGVERLALVILCDAYDQETLEGGETRVVLRLHPALSPIKVAVLPLSKKLSEQARVVHRQLLESFPCDFDDSGSIGRRYRRQDEIGTPYCVTFDFDSLEDNAVTVRDRDTMQQDRVPIAELASYLSAKIAESEVKVKVEE